MRGSRDGSGRKGRKSKVNWKRLLCYIGWHKPVLVTELPEKAIFSGGPPLSIPINNPGPGGETQFKGKVVCLWCGKGLKATIEVHRFDILEGKKMAESSLPLREWDIWKKDSEEKIVCGMLGCMNEPTYHCPICGNHYCEAHKLNHFHLRSELTGEGMTFKERK